MTLPMGGSSAPRRKPRTTGERNARRVELVSQGVAGGIGTAFGAAKLRDAYHKDLVHEHGKIRGNREFNRKVKTVGRAVQRVGGSPQTAAKVAGLARKTPGFKPLAVAVGAGSLATGAHRYQEINHYLERKRGDLSKRGIRRTGPRIRLAVPNPVPAKHAVRPYIGVHRKPSLTDKVKAQSLLHGNRLYDATDAAVGLLS